MNIRLIAFSILMGLSTIAYPQEKSHFATAKEGASKAVTFVKKNWDWKVTAGLGLGIAIIGGCRDSHFEGKAFDIALEYLKTKSLDAKYHKKSANNMVKAMRDHVSGKKVLETSQFTNVALFTNQEFKGYCQKSYNNSVLTGLGIIVVAGALVYAGGKKIYTKIVGNKEEKAPEVVPTPAHSV